jgi:hypothetical protein
MATKYSKLFGQIQDSTNKAIQGAEIYPANRLGIPKLLGTKTVSDEKGRFTLSNVTSDDYIVVRRVGYAPKITRLDKVVGIPMPPTMTPVPTLVVKLDADASSTLPEVTVTPQGTQTNTGSQTGTQTGTPTGEVPKKKKVWLYVGIGVAVVGLIVVAVVLSKKNSKGKN